LFSFALCREDEQKAISGVDDIAHKGCQEDTQVVVILLLVVHFAGIEQSGIGIGG